MAVGGEYCSFMLRISRAKGVNCIAPRLPACISICVFDFKRYRGYHILYSLHSFLNIPDAFPNPSGMGLIKFNANTVLLLLLLPPVLRPVLFSVEQE